MFYWLLLIFVVVPVVELLLLGWLRDATSLLFTIVTILVTGFVGAALAKRQGLRTWRRIQENLAAGQTPAVDVLDGVLILMAGAVLITPGLMTDAVGFLLLIPQTRRYVGLWLARWFKRRAVARFEVYTSGLRSGESSVGSPDEPTIIDAEFERVSDNPPAEHS